MNLIKGTILSITTWLVLFGLVIHTHAQTSKKALLWEVSGNGLKEKSYLFGTYHLLTHKFLAETPEIKAPMKSAKGVVVELVIDSSKLQAMSAMAIMPDTKISNLLSPEDFKMVSAEVEKLTGANLTMMDQLKPMTIMVMMTMIYAQKENEEILKKYPGLPMDYFFAAEGKKAGKTITPLETLEEQINLLYNHFPISEQATQLVSYVKQKEMAAEAQVRLLNYYLDKDLDQMFAFTESLPEDMGNGDYLLKNRNEKWMTILPGLMKTQSQFIAVGSLHLPGPDGLITLLKKQGYTVKPMTQ